MARASTPTLLPLDTYAQIMGINPVQFNSGIAATLFQDTGDLDRWVQYSWQKEDFVSREDLAREIARAEQDIFSKGLKYWPAPSWTLEERVMYPRYHRPELTGLRGYDQSGRYKSVTLNAGRFIQGGKRATTLIGTPTISLSDEDSDSVEETVTVTVATTVTDVCEVKVFFEGKSAHPSWEIRPPISASISGGVYTATFPAWLFVKPSLWEAYPTTNPSILTVDVESSANFVTEVDVYRVYNDPEEQCTFVWEGAPNTCSSCGGGGCPQCDDVTQSGCLAVRNADIGQVAPMPADYDSGSFTVGTFCTGREPDRVLISYQSGVREDDNFNGCYDVPYDLAMAITYMATARLSRPMCHNSERLKQREEELKTDLIFIQKGDADTRFVTSEVMKCPFGTKYGELEAWRIIKDRVGAGQSSKVTVALA